MEVVVVFQPDDWIDCSETETRIVGVFASKGLAESAVRQMVEESVKGQRFASAAARHVWLAQECERFAFEKLEIVEKL